MSTNSLYSDIIVDYVNLVKISPLLIETDITPN